MENLKECLKPVNGGSPLLLAKQNFRKLGVVYFCTAKANFENCINFAPSPTGKCTFQKNDETQNPTCRKDL